LRAKDVHVGICKDLMDSGIYLNPKDVHYLLYIILKNIKEVCSKTDKLYLARDKQIIASLVGNNIKINLSDKYKVRSKIIRMSDRTSNKMFESMLLPSIIELLNSEED